MVVVQDREDVREVLGHGGDLQALDAEPACYQGSIELMTSQRRRLGSTTCLLVNLPCTRAGAFLVAVSLRGKVGRDIKVENFEIDGQPGHPSAASALQLSDQWINGGLDVATAEEHATGQE